MDTKSLPENISGLREADITVLQKKFGKNIFKADQQRNIFHILWDIIKEPMFLLLLLACSLYFILGQGKEGMMMLVAMVLVGAISVYQEIKSTKALAALKQYSEPRITVIRDGKDQIILSEDLLPGDIMLLEEGNRIPADAMVVQQNDFTVNESIITGESLPVDKNETESSKTLFQGTTVNSGKCYAQVTTIGNDTVLGKLGKSINTISTAKTLLQDQISRFVKIMASIGLATFAVIWLVNYLHSGNLVQSLLFGLTLAMSVIPEEIPVAFTSFMALGAYHMARLGIITRQPQTIENLGAVSVICLDKTGTITENKMQVKTIYDDETNLVEQLDEVKILQNGNVLRYARLASEMSPFDAMEKAIVEAYLEHIAEAHEQPDEIIHEYPLSGQPPMMTHVYKINNTKIVAGKGAPERILRICKVDDATAKKTRQMVIKMAATGYRVIGVCSAIQTDESYPGSQDDFNWKFEGVLALYDPPKKNVQAEFTRWYNAGIRIKLITGDYAETAMNIARQVGMRDIERPASGEAVMKLSSEELQEMVKTTNLYARMFPEAKLKVIEALKANGEIVAMTGDGVNDGPALKASHIGIAMGDGGTEIAKEAADLVITDDNVEKISEAIQQGRRIYSNLKKAVRYIISIHIPIILTASLPVLLGWKFPNIFTPIHVIFLELIMGPTCSIFFEREPVEANIFSIPPRERTANIFSGKELLVSIVQGLIIANGLLTLYFYFMQAGYNLEYVRTIVFTCILWGNVFLTIANRSFEETIAKTMRYKNALAPYVIIASVAMLAMLHLIPPVQKLFQLTHISLLHFLLCAATSLVCVGWFEIYKLRYGKKQVAVFAD